MIHKILSLKKHKTQGALSQMHQDEITLEHEKHELEQLQRTIETLRVAHQLEADRLFKELSNAPATIGELEAYNASLAKMKHKLDKHYLEQTASESRVEAAQKQLVESQNALVVATQKQEKYTYLSQRSNDHACTEAEYREEQFIEEINDTMFSSSGSAAFAYGVL